VKQLGLFGSGTRTIADDERGRIVYMPAFLSEWRQRTVFEALLHGVQWRAERRMMYDREVDVPRLVASFGVTDLPEPLRDVLPDVEAATQTRFTGVGLNLYRDGRDSVAPHNDHLDEIAEGKPIALLSLGATRKMTIRRTKAAPHPGPGSGTGKHGADELRDAAPLRSRHSEDDSRGWSANQCCISRAASPLQLTFR
jgi:hypothetical protein